MLGCVAFSVYCHAGSAHKCKVRLSCVLNTVLDLAAAALCIAREDEGHTLIKDWIGFGSWSAVHCVEGGGKVNAGSIV